MRLPSSLRDASLSQSMGTSQAGQNRFTFFSRWMFISDRDGIINLHQVPTSQQAADIDDNGHYGFALAFLSTSASLVSMTA